MDNKLERRPRFVDHVVVEVSGGSLAFSGSGRMEVMAESQVSSRHTIITNLHCCSFFILMSTLSGFSQGHFTTFNFQLLSQALEKPYMLNLEFFPPEQSWLSRSSIISYDNAYFYINLYINEKNCALILHISHHKTLAVEMCFYNCVDSLLRKEVMA